MTRSKLLHHAVLISLTLLASACAHGTGARTTANTSKGLLVYPAAAPADSRQPGTDAKLNIPVTVENSAVATATGDAARGVTPQNLGDPTQVEQDFSAIYGSDPGPTRPTPAAGSESYDPWEKYNRRVYAFNLVIDRILAKPLAKTYVKVVPEPARNGVTNFFNNLSQPLTIVNALLQGKGNVAAQSVGRFALNTTVGIGGIFDPATRAHLPNRREDLGQTLGVWGWKHSRYLQLPLFGPSTVRDAIGILGNAPLSPLRYVGDANAGIFLRGLQLADLRTRLFPLDNLLVGASDEYALVRDSWLQRRDYQIFKDSDSRVKGGEQPLPDYLRDDVSDPIAPNDVLPTIPGN